MVTPNKMLHSPWLQNVVSFFGGLALFLKEIASRCTTMRFQMNGPLTKIWKISLNNPHTFRKFIKQFPSSDFCFDQICINPFFLVFYYSSDHFCLHFTCTPFSPSTSENKRQFLFFSIKQHNNIKHNYSLCFK